MFKLVGNTWQTDTNTFIPEMEGGIIQGTVEPYYSYLKTSGYTWNSSYTSSIVQVVNPMIAVISNDYFAVTKSGYIFVNTTAVLLTGSINWSTTTYVPTTITSSLVSVDLIDLDTFTGKVHKVYIYKRSLSKLEDYTLHSVVNIEESNLLSVEDIYGVDYRDIGKYTPEIISQDWISHRQIYTDGNTADRVVTGWPYAGPVYDSRLTENTNLSISSSVVGIVEQFVAKDVPTVGTLQFSGSAAWTIDESVVSLVSIVNSGSKYLTASFVTKSKGGGDYQHVITFTIRDSYTGSFDFWYLSASGYPSGISNAIVNAELSDNLFVPLNLNSKFPTPSGYNLSTSSGYFSNAVQISESYYSHNYFGEVPSGNITSSLKMYCYKPFYTIMSMSLYVDTEYVHEAYIAGFGELEIRLVGNAVVPDDDHLPLFGKLIGHYSSSKLTNYGYQSHIFTPNNTGTVHLYYIVKSGIWDIGRSSIVIHVPEGYSANRNLFRFPVLPLSQTEEFQFKLIFANPSNIVNPVEIISPIKQFSAGIITIDTGGGFSMPISPLGSVIYSDGLRWRPATPITGTSGSGWLVNDAGLLIVNYIFP
jgi:hypothetical protein